LDLFYQKSVTNHSVGGCGEEKGFKGKGNRRSRRSLSAPGRLSLAPPFGGARKKKKTEKNQWRTAGDVKK